ncbi:Interferon-induced GTP-binding protein Mx1 [Pleurostoma richardsiae]|uniref:Interferon-induced GTP-binding protein Mx1 n=1 Tax=Pleurostoma richardsiae TaxID=41990 RepID=A0AA38RGC6_9PEZI|nr:Interferon-induced GTP-binding protein Mx1 [Pleurostoma richardsiae]
MDSPPTMSLGNQTILAKVDKLRELNVGSLVPLPQLVVVGDQSSGKSSVLESLTGFSFPSATTLCTRYATQITCIRDAQRSISISIIPRPGVDEVTQTRLRQFRRSATDLDGQDLAQIFDDANRVMGIRPAGSGSDDGSVDDFAPDLITFSEDILKIEISGPDESHLTVIDVPGIFRNSTPGLTTESDIPLVKNMVTKYMKDPRTIILAVIPCNVDVATQEVLELAKDVDPNGIRTMGVLTKPDLAVERATQQNALDLVLGKRNYLKLGYCVVKNRGADDHVSTLAQRYKLEKEFFRKDPWSVLASTGRAGVDALKRRLSDLLMDISKREFPNVKMEVLKLLNDNRKQYESMGESRGDERSQRMYLGRLAAQFERTVNYALNAYYTEDKIFENLNMRLITKIIGLNEMFAEVFRLRGHTRQFEGDDDENSQDTGGIKDNEESKHHGKDAPAVSFDEESKSRPDKGLCRLAFDIPIDTYPELYEIIIMEPFDCPEPSDDSILDHIEEIFSLSRGPELGTFGGALLATTFKEQSQKWEQLVLSHVSKAIVVVHDFIFQLLTATVPEKQVRDELWDNVILEKLQTAYARAMAHARFLLDIEREGKPMTFNQYFAQNLQKARADRMHSALGKLTKNVGAGAGRQDDRPGAAAGQDVVLLEAVRSVALNKSNPQQVREDLHDILKSYYKIALKRFVDVVCQHVVDHFLLTARDGPLAVFGTELVLELTPGQLESVAGEDVVTRQERQRLEEEIKNLDAAIKVLRS